ncbi:MAG: family 10 glycosylhydrolase [Candidatus Obscuribacterales bacterium]|nr:family 10 glycosylhydrolase [Candidatus Obscuribacterales bacterium]
MNHQIRKFLLFFVLFSLGIALQFFSAVWAAAPIAVLKSAKNSDAYQAQNIGSYDEDWQSFRRTLDAANLRYDIIPDADLTTSKLTQYKVVILPLLIDLPGDGVDAIQQFIKQGGKIVATDGGGATSNHANIIDALCGVTIINHNAIQDTEQLTWSRGSQSYAQDFAIGTLIAEVSPSSDATPLAKWTDSNGKPIGVAVSKMDGNIFIGWAPGLQGETSTNASILSMVLDEAVPGLSKSATIQISSSDYQKIQDDLTALQKRAEDAIATAKQADLAVPLNVIQKHYEQAMIHTRAFKDFYSQRKFFEADGELNAARNELSLAYAQAMPVRLVEARSIWLDRGTIVSCQNAVGMSALFDKLKKAGINVVYFETNNAGFTMFPSKVSTQNPQTTNWNPLLSAIQEAHKRGMELHAWFWTFNVGNTFHNPIITQEPDYPGPVLSTHDFAWGLASHTGAFVPPKQHEFWLDPSSPEARTFIKSLILEVVKNYDVDGIQLDYIRYPFNGKGGEMGFDFAGRLNFERETRLSLDRLDDRTRKAWIAWKSKQVSSLVQDVSSMVRAAKPNLRISAAVYAMPRDQRMNLIQQDWELWVANGWVDTLNPMTYVVKGGELQKMAGSVQKSSDNKAMVLPGLFIKDLDTAGFVEQLDISRALGSLGNTMFAAAQLDDKKSSVLQLGPYRKSPLMTPQADPIRAATLIFDGFSRSITRYVQDPERPIVSDRSSTNEILTQTELIQRQLHSFPANATPEQIGAVATQINALDISVKEWLAIENFARRSPRANYISTYIDQANAILTYAAHKSKMRATNAKTKSQVSLPQTLADQKDQQVKQSLR